MNKLVVIDGHALLFRAFHATSDTRMSTSAGEPTNAVFGFAASLLKTLQSEAPTHVAVAFDLPVPTFRHERYVHYKAHRPPMDPTLAVQVSRVRELVETFGFPIYDAPGYEADDVIGTIARQAAEANLDTVILTGDLDTLQLVGPHTRILTPRRGPFDTTLYDTEAVLARYGIAPLRLPDFKALVGDTSDNIPGVQGIGEKTASRLLAQYGSLEDIYAHLSDLPERQRRLLDGRLDAALTSKFLATILTNAPVTLDLTLGLLTQLPHQAVLNLFTELEFFSLIGRIPGTAAAVPVPAAETHRAAEKQQPPAVADGQGQMVFADSAVVASADDDHPMLATTTLSGDMLGVAVEDEDRRYAAAEEVLQDDTTASYIIDTAEAFDELLRRLERRQEWSLDLETTGKNPIGADLVGIALSADPGIGYYIPVGHREGVQLAVDYVLSRLQPWLERDDARKIGHNLKYDIAVLRSLGYRVSGVYFDTMVAAYLLNPAQRGLGLKDQAAARFRVEMTPISALIGTGRDQRTMAEVSIAQAAAYAAADADMTLRLRRDLEPELRAQELFDLFRTVEMPLVSVLAEMEYEGVDLDVEFLRSMSGELQQQFQLIEQRIFELVGHPFNINSPRQLETVLFRERALPPGRRTSTGYSTDAEVLEALRGKDPVVDLVLEYRQLTKLRSTYVEGLPALLNSRTRRLHTSFNQTIAATGRLSSSEPNLQNIPVRTEIGHKVRRAFISGTPGWVLLAADYSQIELRIVAHLAHDPMLMQAFVENLDVHASTASLVFGVPVAVVTPEMRRMAKTINFGIIYGLSDFGLANRTGTSVSEARAFIQRYNSTYSGLYHYMERVRDEARKNGYVTTLLNRRRYVPDVNSPVRSVREEALRAAINMPVQGAAADMIKLAMINLHRQLPAGGLHGCMILQVHDELLLRLPEVELHDTARLVRSVMETALPLSVPVRVDLKWGSDWYSMQAIQE